MTLPLPWYAIVTPEMQGKTRRLTEILDLQSSCELITYADKNVPDVVNI